MTLHLVHSHLIVDYGRLLETFGYIKSSYRVCLSKLFSTLFETDSRYGDIFTRVSNLLTLVRNARIHRLGCVKLLRTGYVIHYVHSYALKDIIKHSATGFQDEKKRVGMLRAFGGQAEGTLFPLLSV